MAFSCHAAWFVSGGIARSMPSDRPTVCVLLVLGPRTANGFTSLQKGWQVPYLASAIPQRTARASYRYHHRGGRHRHGSGWEVIYHLGGTRDSMVWIHDQSGEHPISSQGEAARLAVSGTREYRRQKTVSFSSDGKKFYYLAENGQTTGTELWVREIDTGNTERVLPGYSMDDYSVSRDEKQVAFANADESGRYSLWVASTDHRSSPRHIVSSGSDDTPVFLPDGDLVFRAIEGGTNFLYRMHADGSDRQKVSPDHILDFQVLSPDGRWAVVQAPDANAEQPYGVFAFPVEGGSPVRLCINICFPKWDTRGDFMYISYLEQADPNSYALPVRRDSGLPDLPSTVIAGTNDLKKLKSAVVMPHIVDSAFSSSLYVYAIPTIRRNLYRIPLQ